MTIPGHSPSAVFSGSLVNPAGGWLPAQAMLGQGLVTLSVGTPTGWVPQFSVPVGEVAVKSAAQRITLVVRGQSYPLLADPAAAGRAFRLQTVRFAGSGGNPAASLANNTGRLMNQAAAAAAFDATGGGAFLAAMRASGASVSRLGYGAIAAIGCGVALLVALVVFVIVFLVIGR